jgi:phage terminase large subunit-like protein
MSWIGRELQNNMSLSSNNGVHFMPLKNIDDLCTIFQSLNNIHRSSSDKVDC